MDNVKLQRLTELLKPIIAEERKKLSEAPPVIVQAKKFPKVTLRLLPNQISIQQADENGTSQVIKMTPTQFSSLLSKYTSMKK